MKIVKTQVQAKTRTLSAYWTFEEYQDIKSEQFDNVLDERVLSEQLAAKLCARGWVRVVLEPMCWETTIDVDQWLVSNCRAQFKNMGLVWLFESPRDATLFILKWRRDKNIS